MSCGWSYYPLSFWRFGILKSKAIEEVVNVVVFLTWRMVHQFLGSSYFFSLPSSVFQSKILQKDGWEEVVDVVVFITWRMVLHFWILCIYDSFLNVYIGFYIYYSYLFFELNWYWRYSISSHFILYTVLCISIQDIAKGWLGRGLLEVFFSVHKHNNVLNTLYKHLIII